MRLSILSEDIDIGAQTGSFIVISIDGRRYRYWVNPFIQREFKQALRHARRYNYDENGAINILRRAAGDDWDKWVDGKWVRGTD